MSARHTLRLLLRHLRAELRGGIKGFRLFLMCLVLGVGAFSTILATEEVLLRSLESNAAVILGGDVEVQQVHTVLEAQTLEVFAQQTRALSHISLLRTMARGVRGEEEESSVLVELKAVDDNHPLVGGLFLQGGKAVSAAALSSLLVEKNGVWGAVVAPAFLAEQEEAAGRGRLFVLGRQTFEVRAVLEQESDLLSSSFPLGARVLLSQRGLDATGLRVPGSLIYEHYRMLLHEGESIAEFRTRVQQMFPDAAWTLEDRREAAPRVRQIIDRLSLFMTLAALAGMFAGGAGIANGLTCLLRARRTDMALWKTLGASTGYIRLLLGLQTGGMGVIGIVMGCAIGVVGSLLLAPWVGDRFSLPVDVFFPLASLLRSAGVGFCVLVLFALLPFLEIDQVAPSLLLRGKAASPKHDSGVRSRAKVVRLLVVGLPVFAGLCVLMVAGSSSPLFSLAMLLSFLLSLWIFPLASRGTLALARMAKARARVRLPLLDYALQQTRSSALLSIVLPLGLGLSLFVALAEIELSLTRDAEAGLSEEAPRQFFIDLQPWQAEAFREKVESLGERVRLEQAPMLRGRILGFNDLAADKLEVPADYEWVLEGDRGISFSSVVPKNSIVVEGEWWEEDYEGALLVSFDAEVARAFELKIGDRVRVGVLGKVLEAKIANLREMNWRTWQINFMMVFSPHASLEDLPFTVLAAAFSTDGLEQRVDAVVARDFPNVTVLRIGDFVRVIKSLLQGMTHAVRAVSALTLALGAVVLSSAIVVEQRRRLYEAVVMKTLGISRRKILLAFFLEYVLVGGSVALLSVVLGGLLGWAILRFAMETREVVFSTGVSLLIVLGVLALSALCSGVSGAWVLSRSSWTVLRNP